MDEERVVGLRVLHQPLHGPKDIGLVGYTHRVLLIVREDDHVLPPIPILLVQKG